MTDEIIKCPKEKASCEDLEEEVAKLLIFDRLMDYTAKEFTKEIFETLVTDIIIKTIIFKSPIPDPKKEIAEILAKAGWKLLGWNLSLRSRSKV